MIHTLRQLDGRRSVALLLSLTLLITLFGFTPGAAPARAADGNVTIVAYDRHTDVEIGEFRFIVNEDIATRAIDVAPNGLSGPSQQGPKSFSPVVALGDQDSADITLPDGRYLVSVIAGDGAPAPGDYGLSGAPFDIVDGVPVSAVVGVVQNETEVHVGLIPNPAPTGSIAVIVHHDNYMVNGAYDQPVEDGLEGFSVRLEDGTGEVSVDYWGNPLCTEYDGFEPDGTPIPVPGTGGECLTDANGLVVIKNLAAHKYGAFAIPPDGSGWVQTSTIEGTHVVDVWLEAGNPGIAIEAGAVGPQVLLGFVQECSFAKCPQFDNKGRLRFPKEPTIPLGTATITGRAVEASEAGGEFNPVPGAYIDRPYVALNNLSGNDEQVYTGRGNPDGTFSIPNVPPGTYQVVVWDEPQMYIITFETAVVEAGDTVVDMGDIMLGSWFGHVQGFSYWDTGLTPDGRIIDVPAAYDGGVQPGVPGYANGFRDCMSDASGIYDYANCEPGVNGQDFTIHFNDGSAKYGAVADSHGFYSVDNHFPYNHYLIWETGYGGGRQLYTTGYFTDFVNGEAVPQQGYPYTAEHISGGDEPTVDGGSLVQAEITLAGYYNWIDTGMIPHNSEFQPDPAVDNGGVSGIVFYGVTRNEFDARIAAVEDYEPGVPGVTVNLWRAVIGADDTPVACTADDHAADPAACPYGQGELMRDYDTDSNGAAVPVESVETDSYYDARPTHCLYPDLTTLADDLQIDELCREVPLNTRQIQDGVFDGGFAFSSENPIGDYIVEMIPPENYRGIKEEDQNTDQGDDYVPAIEPAPCAGPLHLVNDPRNPAHGQMKPLCDSKLVRFNEGLNPGLEFFLMVDFDDSVDDSGNPVSGFAGTTEVPPPGLLRGTVFDDLVTQTNPDSVMFGGKRGVANVPIGVLDYEGNEIAIGQTDSEGFFEILVPSTYTRLCPTPGGVCAGMYQVVANYPGTAENPQPNWSLDYQTLNNTLDVWTGKTTYADLAVLPTSAGWFINSPSCPALGPEISEVSQVVFASGSSDMLTVTGTGLAGATSSVGTVTASSNTSLTISGIGGLAPGVHQLTVTAGGQTSESGITLHVTGTGYNPTVRHVGSDQTYTTIQAAINESVQPPNNGPNNNNDPTPNLIVVHPGTYFESPIVDKRVKIQGYGPGATKVDGRFLGFSGVPFDVDAWAADVASRNPSRGDVPAGQVFTVIATGNGSTHRLTDPRIVPKYETQIDGLYVIGGSEVRVNTIGTSFTGTTQGGGIYVHGDGENLIISNNTVQANFGFRGGGVILGQPYVGGNNNPNVRIHHNRILNNGGAFLAGGLAIFDGADGYRIDHNLICGNSSGEYGGGISHFGRSEGGSIDHNRIVYNAAFDEGGGVIVAGELPLDPGTLTEGSGAVTIDANLIQHNVSNDDGGGIRLLMSEDGSNSTSDHVAITNNMVVNNLATDIGGGIALDDAPDTQIINNTITNNVATGSAEDSDGQFHAAGVTSTPHTAALAGAPAGGDGFSDPVMFNNIIWHNEAWVHDPANPFTDPLDFGGYIDLEVVGGGGVTMTPEYSVLTSPYGTGAGNIIGDPMFQGEIPTVFTALADPGAVNLVYVSIDTPDTQPQGDYHLTAGSVAIDAGDGGNGQDTAPIADIDGDTRPSGGDYDIGADEVVVQ